MIDVVIVGGSYAGLAAGLIIDAGQRRNRDIAHAGISAHQSLVFAR